MIRSLGLWGCVAAVSVALVGCGAGQKKFDEMGEPELESLVEKTKVEDWQSSGNETIDASGQVIVEKARVNIAELNKLRKTLIGSDVINNFNRSLQAELASTPNPTPEQKETARIKIRKGYSPEELAKLDAEIAASKATVEAESKSQAATFELLSKLLKEISSASKDSGLGLLVSGASSKDQFDKVNDQMNAAKSLLNSYKVKLDLLAEASARNVERAKEGK